jgi:hypothetical protein
VILVVDEVTISGGTIRAGKRIFSHLFPQATVLGCSFDDLDRSIFKDPVTGYNIPPWRRAEDALLHGASGVIDGPEAGELGSLTALAERAYAGNRGGIAQKHISEETITLRKSVSELYQKTELFLAKYPSLISILNMASQMDLLPPAAAYFTKELLPMTDALAASMRRLRELISQDENNVCGFLDELLETCQQVGVLSQQFDTLHEDEAILSFFGYYQQDILHDTYEQVVPCDPGQAERTIEFIEEYRNEISRGLYHRELSGPFGRIGLQALDLKQAMRYAEDPLYVRKSIRTVRKELRQAAVEYYLENEDVAH